MVDLKNVNPYNVTTKGEYYDYENSCTIQLTEEEMEKLYEMYPRDMEVKINIYRRNIANKSSNRNRVSLQRVSPYQGKRVNKMRKLLVPLVIGGIVVSVGVISICQLLKKNSDDLTPPVISGQTANVETVQIVSVPVISIDDLLEDETTPEVEEETLSAEQIYQQNISVCVEEYCAIFQVNYDVVYNKLCELTDNFYGDSFVNEGHISGVTCKGSEIYTDNMEFCLLTAVRAISQLPENFGLTQEELSKDVKVCDESDLDYADSIARFADVVGVDRAFAYAVVRQECGFDSLLFMEKNNPAGLFLGDNPWVFPTKQAGFIEWVLEVLKYNKQGLYTPEEIGPIHCPVDDPRDVKGLNKNWIPNVEKLYQDALEMYELRGYNFDGGTISH